MNNFLKKFLDESSLHFDSEKFAAEMVEIASPENFGGKLISKIVIGFVILVSLTIAAPSFAAEEFDFSDSSQSDGALFSETTIIYDGGSENRQNGFQLENLPTDWTILRGSEIHFKNNSGPPPVDGTPVEMEKWRKNYFQNREIIIVPDENSFNFNDE